MSFSDQELEEFRAESLELLETAEKSLLGLDHGQEYRSSFDAIFRSFHNIKGAAGMMELTKLQAHTHELETRLMSFKNLTSLPKAQIDFFLKGVDAAKSLLRGEDVDFDFKVDDKSPMPLGQPELAKPEIPKSSPSAPALDFQVSDVVENEFFSECTETVERISSSIQLLENENYKKEDLEALYRDIHSVKGSAYLFSHNALGDTAHKMESSLEKVRDGTHLTSKVLLNELFRAIQFMEKEIDCLKNKKVNEDLEALLPSILNGLDFASSKLLPVKIEKQESKTEKKQDLVDGQQIQEKHSEVNASIRVSVSLLDNLMTLMGEMVLVRNQVMQFSSRSDDLEFLNLSKRLNVVTSEIQGEMMKTRMQPIGNILTKFSRVVRDLSQELSKDIVLNLVGADTELDKSLLEAIKDPLTHIVRNSCDHGIEKPEVRLQSGKPKNGSITIRSFHEGGQVVIEIKDDGKGLQKDVLLKKAIEKSLITTAQSTNMTEKEILNLIFAPGFSTAAKVTNVSGRGVGMDVVRTNVEKIGGTVDLTSVSGKGTTIKLKIPLTLAIVPALIIKSGGASFAIPQVKLEELVRVDQSAVDNKIEYLHGTPVYRLRGHILPLVNLNRILGFATPDSKSGSICNIAVLNADQCSFGLIVDEIQDSADIVVKPINGLLKSLQIFSGATILGDASIALILDVAGISKVTQIGLEASKEDEKSKRRFGDKNENESIESQEYLLVKVNSPTKYAIVLGYVHRLEEFKSSRVEYSGAQRVVRYNDSILPIIDVNQLLGLEKPKDANPKAVISVVVIQKAGVNYGLEVEEIIDTLSTEVEMSSSFVKQLGIFGNLNMPNELIVVVDPFDLIRHVFGAPDNEDLEVENTAAKIANIELPRSLKILLVEDTVFFRKCIARVLNDAGHEVSFAIDGRDAIEILDKDGQKFDLLVSDIEMPRMTGFELAKAVRANPLIAHLPMLAISSRADKGYIEKGRLAGFNIYLEKLKSGVLLDAIQQLVPHQRRAG